MRTEQYVTRLFGMIHDQNVDPKKLARTYLKTLVQIAETNKQGPEAEAYIRNTIFNDGMRSLTGKTVRRIRRNPRSKEPKTAPVKEVSNKVGKNDKPGVAPAKSRMTDETRAKISATMKKRHRERRKRHNDFIAESVAS